MRLTRRNFLTTAAALAAAPATPLFAQTGQKLPVVATFSILGDMVARIGGDRIALTTLVGPDGDTHVYQPTPADARAVASASLLVTNGLAFEGWLDRLVEAAEFKGQSIVATDGIELISYDDEHGHDEHGHEDHDDHGHEEHGHDDDDKHEHEAHGHDDDDKHEHEAHGHDDHDEHGHDDHAGHDDHDHGEFDPHAWQDVGSGVIYARNIAKGLSAVDPEGAGAYAAAAEAYVAELNALDAEIRGMFSAVPDDRRTVVTSHDAFGYFGRAYGIEFLAPQGLSTNSEASAADVARLIEQIKERKITALFVENITDKRLIEQIALETGAKIGGTLYPGALSDPGGPAPTYLDMMRHNARTISEALAV